MKIYIDEYDINKLVTCFDAIDKYYKNTIINTMILSEQGIFTVDNTVDNTEVNSLIINDVPIQRFIVLDKFKLIIDNSITEKKKVYGLPNQHVAIIRTLLYYSVDNNDNIKFVVEGDGTYLCNALPKQKYTDFKPSDFYFQVSNDIDIQSILINDSLIEFLSLLN